jgi:hypothetical protein
VTPTPSVIKHHISKHFKKCDADHGYKKNVIMKDENGDTWKAFSVESSGATWIRIQ